LAPVIQLSDHQVGCQFSDARGTKLDQHVPEVIGQAFDHLLHAFLSRSGKGPEDRPTDRVVVAMIDRRRLRDDYR
jgi:hypothetical protein